MRLLCLSNNITYRAARSEFLPCWVAPELIDRNGYSVLNDTIEVLEGGDNIR